MLGKIKKLREETNVSVALCKRVLEESAGDLDKAMEILRRESAIIAEKKSERALKAGIIDAYIHNTKQIGVLLEARCETDFVAKNIDFQNFSHNIAMHIAALAPTDIDMLFGQPYIKNPEITIADYIKEAIQKFGENIEISRFERYQI